MKTNKIFSRTGKCVICTVLAAGILYAAGYFGFHALWPKSMAEQHIVGGDLRAIDESQVAEILLVPPKQYAADPLPLMPEETQTLLSLFQLQKFDGGNWQRDDSPYIDWYRVNAPEFGIRFTDGSVLVLRFTRILTAGAEGGPGWELKHIPTWHSETLWDAQIAPIREFYNEMLQRYDVISYDPAAEAG